ncbi:hypothetical protein FQR65_LT17984 [Abscondita terminalis]|nr:hypothetical protein FQR65_LT17984 [Abscondita terminalis]
MKRQHLSLSKPRMNGASGGKLRKLCLLHEQMMKNSGLRFEKAYPEMGNGKSGLRKAIPKQERLRLTNLGRNSMKLKGAKWLTASNLDAYLRNNRIENLYLVGYATHVCVESTLRDAHDKGYNTFLLSDATAAFNKKQQDYVLQEIVHHFGEHLTTKEFVGY